MCFFLLPSSDLSIFNGSILDLFLSLKPSSQNDVHHSHIFKNPYFNNLLNTLFCRISPMRWSKTCMSQEVRSILLGTILHHDFWRIFKIGCDQVLILTFFIGCEVLGVSHGCGSLMCTYNKRKEFLYPSYLCPARHSTNFKIIYIQEFLHSESIFILTTITGDPKGCKDN